MTPHTAPERGERGGWNRTEDRRECVFALGESPPPAGAASEPTETDQDQPPGGGPTRISQGPLDGEAIKKRISAASLIAILVAMYAAVVVRTLLYMDRLNDRELISQNARAAQGSMETFTDRLSNSLDLIEAYLFNLVYQSADVQRLERPSSDIDRYAALGRLSMQLDNIVQLVPGIDGVWLCLPGGDEADLITRSAYHGNTLVRQGEIRPAILALLASDSGDAIGRGWLDLDVAGAACLLYMQRIGSVSCGAWINRTFLEQQAGAISFVVPPAELSLVASDSDEASWRQSGDDVIIEAPLNFCQLVLQARFDRAVLLSSSRETSGYLGFSVGLVLYSVLIFAVLQFMLHRPVHGLITDIQTIRAGNLKHRVRISRGFSGFSELCQTINGLLDQLDALKISIYEEQLDRQNIERQYLQIQLKTHFLLNCLNIIHAMARTRNTDLIQELTEHLVNYLRYIQNQGEALVTLEVELAHVENYAQIQRLRFPGLFDYSLDVDEDVLSEEIPPLLIQTFIENTVEHAMSREKRTSMRVMARYEERSEQLGLCIVVEDDGIGFPPEVLSALNGARDELVRNGHRSIGILNIKNRLRLQYGGRAELVTANREGGGARVRIWLPIDVAEE